MVHVSYVIDVKQKRSVTNHSAYIGGKAFENSKSHTQVVASATLTELITELACDFEMGFATSNGIWVVLEGLECVS